jgi:hypothetical protein
MKLTIRIFATAIIFVSAAAAIVSPSATPYQVSHLSAASMLPSPGCGPGMHCPPSSK